MASEYDLPTYERPETQAARPALQLVGDLLGGTAAIHASRALESYVPKWPDEDPNTWAKRARAATLYEGLGRTLSASTGMLFQVPPQVTFPAGATRLEPHWWDVDGAGTKGDVFAKRFAELCLAHGHALIVVDFPQGPQGIVTQATERQLNLRPRWRAYHRGAIRAWRTGLVNNRVALLQVTLDEPAEEAAGRFGIRAVHRIRELVVEDGVAQYRLWQEPEHETGEWTVVEAGVFRDRAGNTRAELPVAVGYGGRTDAPLTSVPPLLGVAFANLSHFRNKTELAWGSRIAGVEQFVIAGDLAPDPVTGLPPAGIPIGWEHVLKLTAGGSAQWVGPSGTGLGQLEQRMREAEQEMAALGMSFLSRDTRAAETAEAKRLDATAENSTLATAAQGIEDALNLAWSHHAWYEGIAETDAPSLVITRDFDRVTLDATYISAIGALVQQGFPVRVAVQMLAQGGVIPTTDEAELDLLALEWQAGGQARADAEAMAQAQLLSPPAAA